MATSSITHNFVISNPNSVKLFISKTIDEANKPKQTLPGRQFKQPRNLILMSKRKKTNYFKY